MGEYVHGGQAVGQRHGTAKRGQQDGGAYLDPLGASGDGSHGGHRLQPRLGDEAVAHPYRVEARGLCPLGKLEHGVRIGGALLSLRLHAQAARAQQQANRGVSAAPALLLSSSHACQSLSFCEKPGTLSLAQRKSS